MKKFLIVFIALIVFVFSIVLICTLSHKKANEYQPEFILAEGYVLKGDLISGTVIGEGSLRVKDFLLSSDAITVFKGSSTEEFVQGLDAKIPLTSGKNKMVIRFSNGTQEKEYDLEINCIAIQSFSVIVKNPERTYHIGEQFDKSTITVLAITEAGTEFEVQQYTPEYEFSSLGKNIVTIELDGFFESFFVNVTDEYRPTLDVGNTADGVLYHANDDHAILMNAQSKEGFFAVPASVIANGKELPVVEIANNAFSSSWITGILIPDSVQTIGNEAFSECLALEWVEMPVEMESIGYRAFYGCEYLSSIEIPEGITELKSETFRNCKALDFVILPSSLQKISDRVFKECVSLSGIRFPSDLQTIGVESFHSCKKLSTVIVENLNELGDNAFANCEKLKFFCIGNVNTVGNGIFTEAKNLTVYAPLSSSILQKALSEGVKTVTVKENEYTVASLPVEFPIEQKYPYHETLLICFSQGKMMEINNYTVTYPKDACGYLEATISKDDFSHTFTIFISYTEEITLDTDSRDVLYSLDLITGKATLIKAPEWVMPSEVYNPETDGLFIVPTTLWYDGLMYVVVYVEDNAFEQTQNVDKEKIFIPVLTKES